MRKILLGVFIATFVFLLFKFFESRNNLNYQLKENSSLIEQQIKNVGKLVVTEGYFSEVFTYNNTNEFFGNFLTLNKKALVLVNAKATVSYDLSKLSFSLDRENKVLELQSIPEPEITIHPDIEYYDIQAGIFNPFEAKDHSSIKEAISKSLSDKLEQSSLKSNAKARLISELGKFYILTNSLGWTLRYQKKSIKDLSHLENLKY